MSKNTVPCCHCRKEVEKRIKTCPHCGGNAPANTHSQGVLAIAILLALIGLYCYLR